MTKKLHQVIAETIKASPVPLSAAEIAALIAANGSWSRLVDGVSPKGGQISARINNYPELFRKENGKIMLVDDAEPVARLCKIVWNSNGWITPVTRRWSSALQGKPNTPFEKRYGFVHEDWLFNPAFIIGGYHYGLINGFNSLAADVAIIDTVYLFTINPYTKERLYLGKLNNAEKVVEDSLSKKVRSVFRNSNRNMINDLKEVDADHSYLERRPFMPNVRFKVEDKEIFSEPVLIESTSFAKSYKRTLPMKVTSELLGLLDAAQAASAFEFRPSTPYGRRSSYKRKVKASDTSVEKVHNEMEVALYEYLLRKGIDKDNIGCDTIGLGGKLADVVIQRRANHYDIYEIKTATDLRCGLREAVGQLIDYAFWEQGIKVDHLYVVLPYAVLTESMKQYILRVCNALSLPLGVMLYDKDRGLFVAVK